MIEVDRLRTRRWQFSTRTRCFHTPFVSHATFAELLGFGLTRLVRLFYSPHSRTPRVLCDERDCFTESRQTQPAGAGMRRGCSRWFHGCSTLGRSDAASLMGDAAIFHRVRLRRTTRPRFDCVKAF